MNSKKPNDVPISTPYDIDQLKKKYDNEQDKRIRADGISQFHQAAGEFKKYIDDRNATAENNRTSLDDEVEVVAGDGFGGLLAAASSDRDQAHS